MATFFNWVLFAGLPDRATVVLDNVNDLEASNLLALRSMSCTTSARCLAVTIPHRNFGSAKPTGHLGSAMLKNAETVAFVERDNEIVRVRPEYKGMIVLENLPLRYIPNIYRLK